MKTLKLLQLIFFMFVTLYAGGQTITKTTSSNLAGTVCPVSGTGYSVSIPSNFGSCKIKWTVTGGVINGFDNQPSVSVTWNDVRGLTSTIKVTFSGCAEGNPNEGLFDTKSELILSIKDQPFDTFPNNVINLDFCNPPQSIPITVPAMVVDGTGGLGQPARTEAVYLWNLPAGWKDFTTGKTGEFGTPSRSITIVPLACAEPGVIVVKGSLRGWQGCGSSEFSAPANISLNTNLQPPSVSVSPPQGFAGTTSCNTTPVTFTAQVANQGNCSISNYAWTKPASWSIVGPSNGSTITLSPSGTPADAAAIGVKVTFGYGSNRTGSFTPTFKTPVLSGVSPLCDTATFIVSNAQGLALTWTSTNTGIATVNSSGKVTRNGNAGGGVTITATFPCPVQPVTKFTWVGLPSQPGSVSGEMYPSVGGIYQYISSASSQGAAYHNWLLPYYGNPVWSQSGGSINGIINTLTPNLIVGSSSGFVQVFGHNVCGDGGVSKMRVFPVSGGGGGHQQRIAVYPNPTSSNLTIEATPESVAVTDAPVAPEASKAKKEKSFNAKLLDQLGTVLQTADSKKGKIVFDLINLKDGFYYL